MNKRRILVTGGAGFVGRHCVEYMLENTDWEIIVLDLVIGSSIFSANARVEVIEHDLRNSISTANHMVIGKLDYCVHFAAEASIIESFEDSVPFVATNVLGTANLLEYFKKEQLDCKTVIFSSGEVFGPASENISYHDEDRLSPANPYAASKAAEEMLALSFARAFNMPVVVARAMNIFGEGQPAEKFVPKTADAILQGKKVILYSQNDALFLRDWTYVNNISDAVMFLLERGASQQSYNIAGAEKTVLEMANLISQTINGRNLVDDEIEFVDPVALKVALGQRYALSGQKLESLGWKAPVGLEEGLKKYFMENKAYYVNELKVISETLEGETIIINLENGNYYSLNKTGSMIWDAVKSQYAVADIVTDFVYRYDAAEAEIEKSVMDFIAFLKNDNLIAETENPASKISDGTAPIQKELFVAPEIKRYEDMQEMLLADPIHDVDEAGWPTLKQKPS